ncbi:hypothetical protein E4U49_008184 [Claviceps purpurea]|nr:hypothetical protein E4U49_008184 [Claviceps purpurea]
MVQATSLIAAVIAAIAPVAQAKGCTPGVKYCATTLSRYGYDEAKIEQAVLDQGLTMDQKNQLLVNCNADGSIFPVHACRSYCVDGGAGNDDHCGWRG